MDDTKLETGLNKTLLFPVDLQFYNAKLTMLKIISFYLSVLYVI